MFKKPLLQSSLFTRSRLTDPQRAKVLPDAGADESQPLGIALKGFEIRCELEGEPSTRLQRWYVDQGTSELRGALYFQLQFITQGNAPLESAKVRLKLGIPENEEPLPAIYAYAPRRRIAGRGATQKTTRVCKHEPSFGVNVHGAGGQFGGWGVTDTEESEFSSYWVLSAGHPATAEGQAKREIEYLWERGATNDYDGKGRNYSTALIIRRACIKKFSYMLEAQRSNYIHPVPNIMKAEWDHLIRNLDIANASANRDSEPPTPSTPPTDPLAKITQTGVTSVPDSTVTATSPSGQPIQPQAQAAQAGSSSAPGSSVLTDSVPFSATPSISNIQSALATLSTVDTVSP